MAHLDACRFSGEFALNRPASPQKNPRNKLMIQFCALSWDVMSSKIRIKMGEIEVDYEGSEEFLKQELRELLSGVLEMYRESGGATAGLPPISNIPATPGSLTTLNGTTAFFASKLSVKSGSDLAIAAAGRLTLVQGLEQFTREELLKEMQTAKAFYKSSYSSNFSNYLKTLQTSDQLREVSTGKFALSAKEVERVKTLCVS